MLKLWYDPKVDVCAGSVMISSVQFSRSVVSNTLWPHESQHARPPCPSPTPGVYSNPCPSSQWCHPATSSSVVPFSSCPQSLYHHLHHLHQSLPITISSIRVFSNESTLHMRWPKHWSFSFSISPSSEHSGLISFRMDWLDLLAVQGLSRVLSNTTVQKHKFFDTLLSLQYRISKTKYKIRLIIR